MFFLFLLLFFIILNGALTWEILLVGFILCALADLLACKVLGWNSKKSRKLLRLIPSGFCYACLVFKEIIKANIDVIRIILSHDLKEMKPAIFSIDSHLESDFSRTVLANSITITPGTYTVKTSGSRLTVHRLGDGFAFGEDELCFNTALCEIERKEREHK